MKNIKTIFIIGVCLLTVVVSMFTTAVVAATERYYSRALEAFHKAQNAEETARLSTYASDIANYYELAFKNYTLALKEAQRSQETSEELSESEKHNRNRIISESQERIPVCKEGYEKAASSLNAEELKQTASRHIIAGFKDTVSGDKNAARKNWEEAIALYRKALAHTDDKAVQEIIKSKIKEVTHYISKYLKK